MKEARLYTMIIPYVQIQKGTAHFFGYFTGIHRNQLFGINFFIQSNIQLFYGIVQGVFIQQAIHGKKKDFRL
ncbi:MAG: hypothetical protein PHX16_06985 [Syntrophaceticus sp.]|jgi:hypothetical protein|nr:hypothetical protein [Syntrophaceticus sp.]MDD4783363.1 hypothetical protein [Syntrophaceticus sp.]